MRAAIYARRSTDEHQVASLDVQVEEAVRFIERKGWQVAPENIYLEDAVSRAEFKKRPALIAMINAVGAKAFDVIVCRDETRLGGDGPRTTLLIQDIIDDGGRLFYYVSDEEVELTDATAKFMVSVRNFAAELEREKIASRTREHLMTKARRGYNAGGRCYGYDNVDVCEGDRRLRVEFAVNPEQAAIVRDIFERYAEGWGLKRIVKHLNSRKVPSPRAGKRGTGSWCPSAVHAMLRRGTYRGVLTWGRLAKGYRKGTKVRTVCPEHEWLRVDAPHLQVIDNELWLRVQARIGANARNPYRRSPGRPAVHLLSGLARCGACGGPVAVNTGKIGRDPIKVYLCQYHRTRGDEVCTASLRRPMADVDRAVLGYLARNVLTDDVVTDAMKVFRRKLVARTRSTTTEATKLERQAKDLRAEVANLVAALAAGAGANVAPLVQAVADRNEKLRALDLRIDLASRAPEALSAELLRLEQEARSRVADFREVTGSHAAQARSFLEQILAGPMTFTPDGNRFVIEGQVCVPAALFAGMPKGVSPGGFESAISRYRNVASERAIYGKTSRSGERPTS